jgi:hypothetical protein
MSDRISAKLQTTPPLGINIITRETRTSQPHERSAAANSVEYTSCGVKSGITSWVAFKRYTDVTAITYHIAARYGYMAIKNNASE